MPRRARYQCVISLAPGAEPWLIVKTPEGWFRVPGSAAAIEVWERLQDGWGTRPQKARGRLWVRVPLSTALEASANAGD